MANTITTVVSTSSPIVTKVIKNAPQTISDITGVTIDYSTASNGDVLTYLASSNTFVPQEVSVEGIANTSTNTAVWTPANATIRFTRSDDSNFDVNITNVVASSIDGGTY